MARGRGLQHADAEDLTQLVFHSVAQAIDRWNPGPDLPPFRVWLTRIARNAIVNALTKSAKDQAIGGSSVGDLLAAIPNRDTETTQTLVHLGQMQTLRWAANRIRHEFSDDTWAMFWKTTIEEGRQHSSRQTRRLRRDYCSPVEFGYADFDASSSIPLRRLST